MQPEPCAKQVSPCPTVQMSMRVAGRLMQLERLEEAASEIQYQGNQASLPTDLIDIVRRYEQVLHSRPKQFGMSHVILGRHALSSATSLKRRGRQFLRAFFIDAIFVHAQLLASNAQQ